jgi:succinate-acetate transporter protein
MMQHPEERSGMEPQPQYTTRPDGSGYQDRPGAGLAYQRSGYADNEMAAHTTSAGSPDPLGLGMLGFTTIILGAFYASFILPYALGIRSAIAPVLFFGGIVEILAGMWAFRKNSMNTASIFTAYGGFLLILGYMFLPNGILLPLAITGTLRLVLGFFYLCWAILTVVLMLGSFKVNSALRATTILLALAFLVLAIGHFAYDNIVLLRIGGWIAIICALVAWVGTVFQVLGFSGIQEVFKSPKQQEPEQRAAAI